MNINYTNESEFEESGDDNDEDNDCGRSEEKMDTLESIDLGYKGIKLVLEKTSK